LLSRCEPAYLFKPSPTADFQHNESGPTFSLPPLFFLFLSLHTMSLADFKTVKFLGKGSYGAVYRVTRLSDGKDYALKEVKIKYMTQQER
jgi:serine/threonine protein kinase